MQESSSSDKYAGEYYLFCNNRIFRVIQEYIESPRGVWRSNMVWSFNKQERYARVFISYARADGEASAQWLRTRLEEEQIPLWQDRVGLEGGRDWWLQIVEALAKVEYLVLVMTPAAMQSETVRREWRYARPQGVCVYPVKGVPN